MCVFVIQYNLTLSISYLLNVNLFIFILNRREVTTDETAREALLKASSIFAWHAAPVDASKRASMSAMTAGGSSSSSSKKEAKFESADKFRVSGCVSVELGAHALVKFTTRTGTELGSSVVCVTHLLHRDPTLIRSSYMTEVRLSFFLYWVDNQRRNVSFQLRFFVCIFCRFLCRLVDKSVDIFPASFR